MPKSLHVLAKEHNFNQQDLLVALQGAGFDVKNTLVVVDGPAEQWVREKAAQGWTPPPPPEKKVMKKKKVAAPTGVSFKAAAPTRPSTESLRRARPELLAPTTPSSHADEPEPAVAEPVAASEPVAEPPAAVMATEEPPAAAVEPDTAPADTSPIDEAEPAATVTEAPEAAPVAPQAPVVVNRPAAARVSGSAVVGKASPETLAAIRRAQQEEAARLAAQSRSGGRGGPAGGRDRDRPGAGRPDSRDAGRQSAGGFTARGGTTSRPAPGGAPGRSGPAGGRGAPAGAGVGVGLPGDDAGRGRIKQRIKPKARGDYDDAETIEQKRKLAAKRGRGGEPAAWIEDDSYDGGDEEVFEDEADGAVDETEAEAAGLIVHDDDKKAGFKHRRADFRTKKLATELPASFAELDGELARSLTGGGGGRRRVTRGAGRRGPRGGRRSRGPARRVVVARVEGQPAEVFLGMTVRDLSVAMGVKLPEIMGFFLRNGQMIQVNDILSQDDIELVGTEFKTPLEWRKEEDLEDEVAREIEDAELSADESDYCERPPVVTFMGHVDHGKTSLLDYIRKARVAAGEHGGITQHIGAYNVATKDGRKVTFLDTPGHEAFSAMRARGANLTDIVVLVVAADDGVMPQTIEAANHAKSAGVPIVVAINKCDLRSANPDRVRQELSSRLDLLPEEWGGQIGMVQVSAITGMGMDDLLERILLESEMLELKANPARNAVGFVVEAQMTEGQGVVGTMLIRDGTLHRGDVMLCSNGFGKARLMTNEYGQPVDEAGPGTPVRVSGLSAVPDAGDKMVVVADLGKARSLAEQREREARQEALARRAHVTLENLTQHLAGSGVRDLKVVVKADVAGSLEVLEKTLRELATKEVQIDIIHSGVGGINQADVILADASDAIVVGFNVVADPMARTQAQSLGVQVRVYHIIYRLIEDMKTSLEGLLPPEEKEVVQGHIEVRKIFEAKKIGKIAGCFVSDGFVTRQSRLRVIRDHIVIYEGRVGTLKRFADDVREVKSGFECGMTVDGYNDIREGDVLQAYAVEEVARKL